MLHHEPTYEQALEYVVDIGRECDCCSAAAEGCTGITCGPNGPIYPPCSKQPFEELLDVDKAMQIYKEDHDNG